MLHAARARGRAEAKLRLAQHSILPRSETHVARQSEFTAGAACPPAQLRDRDYGQLAELAPQHAQRRILGPSGFRRLGGVLRDLGRDRRAARKTPGPRSQAP